MRLADSNLAEAWRGGIGESPVVQHPDETRCRNPESLEVRGAPAEACVTTAFMRVRRWMPLVLGCGVELVWVTPVTPPREALRSLGGAERRSWLRTTTADGIAMRAEGAARVCTRLTPLIRGGEARRRSDASQEHLYDHSTEPAASRVHARTLQQCMLLRPRHLAAQVR
jgi:hypothetical protein